MAGDNVAISAGLALINLIKAIIELFKSASELKLSNCKEEIASKDNEIKTLKSKIDEVTNDKNKTEEDKKKEVGELNDRLKIAEDKCKDWKEKAESLQNGMDGANKILNEKDNQTIINNINVYMESRKETGSLRFTEVEKIAENIMGNEVISFGKNMHKQSIMHKIDEIQVVVSKELDKKLNEIDPNKPHSEATLDEVIKQNSELAKEARKVKKALKSGRPVYDSQNKPVKTDIGEGQKATVITFGAQGTSERGETK